MDEDSNKSSKSQKQKEINMICLNPECNFSKNRFFTPSSPHSKHQPCKIWFYGIDDLLIHNKSLINDLKNEKSGLLFDFPRDPIESLKKLSSLKRLNWKHMISCMFQQVWNELETQMQLAQKLMVQEIEKHLENSKIYENIIKILSSGTSGESTSKDLSQLLMKSKIPTQSIQMFHPDPIQTLVITIKQAFKISNDAFTCLQVDGLSQTLSLTSASQKTNIEEQMRKLEVWMNQESQNPFSKVQVLAATFGVIPNSYTVEGKVVGLECFLCRENLTMVTPDNNKKNAKKVVTKLVLDHLMSNHHKQIFTNYRKKITKTLIKEFTMDQIIQEIKEGKHKRIEIIDRENSGTYVAEENGQFIFEVVSKRNVSLARGNYVVAQSIAKDAADIVMSFIIKELFNMKNMTVRLVTNDHFGTTIEEICECLKYDFKVISRLKGIR